MVKRLSGLQKQVFALYRSTLREAAKKDRDATPERHSPFVSLLQGTSSTLSYAKSEFRKQAKQVKRTDFRKIEYMMRKGEKQLKLLKMPGTKVVTGAS